MRKRPAFTLIELLVVIAAIAVLTALLVPALSLARKQAKTMVCQSRLRQWGTILALYAQDNEGRFPYNLSGTAGIWLLRGTLLDISNTDANAPQDSLFHFRTKGIACCPLATKYWPDSLWSPGGWPVGGATFNECPCWDGGSPAYPAWVIWAPQPAFIGSYGLNQFLFGPGFQSTGTQLSRAPGEVLPGVNTFALASKANIPVVLDCSDPCGGPPSASEAPPSTQAGSRAWPFCIPRHDDFVNGVFLDWSVRKIGLKELWKLKWSKDFDTNGPWTLAGGVKREDWPEWMRNMRDY